MSDKTGYKKGSKTDSAFSKKPKASRRRSLNRHELEVPEDLNVSTSAKKLKQSDDLYDIEVDDAFSYRLLNFVAVFAAISNVVVCKVCHSEMKFTETSRRDLEFKIVVSCDKCEKTEIPSCPFVKKGYDVNRRIVFVMRLLGIGLRGITKFCAFMEFPRPIFHSFYDEVVQNIASAADVVCKNSISNAAKAEKTISAETGENNGITVSGDGTWKKHEFSSLYGLVSLIGW